MKHRARLGGEEGSAAIEFVVVAVMMLVPLLYLITALSQIETVNYATQYAAREAGRVARFDPERIDEAVNMVYSDFGIERGYRWERYCPEPCTAKTEQLTVTARIKMPLIPDFLTSALKTDIEVRSATVIPKPDITGVQQ
ncbi:MAG: TadE family protein [Varibaculum sp.]|nr:TadE family protein [Varibaculum sp.]